jgi:subtilisin family serine protease
VALLSQPLVQRAFFYGERNFRHFASYSNYGENLVNLAAPGGDFALFPKKGWFRDMVLSTGQGPDDGNFYYYWSAGTSMAAPHVSGVAALIKGANPDISLGALKTKLFQTADDEGKVGKDEYYGHGFVNAARACLG